MPRYVCAGCLSQLLQLAWCQQASSTALLVSGLLPYAAPSLAAALCEAAVSSESFIVADLWVFQLLGELVVAVACCCCCATLPSVLCCLLLLRGITSCYMTKAGCNML